MEHRLDRDFVWECDYGVRKPIIPILKKLIDEQDSSQLQMVQLFIGNNPYNLEFYIVFSYDNPVENQIKTMMDLMINIGVRYRPDITHIELMSYIGNRFFSYTLTESENFESEFYKGFQLMDREEVAKKVSINPLGNKMPVFISHTSRNKLEIEKLIPYLNGSDLPIWYDKISIDYGESIVKKVQEGIKRSGAVIFWITNHFLKSNWCNTEMESFLNRLAGKNDIMIMSIVHSDVKEEELPLFIANKKYLKLKGNEEIKKIADEIIPSIKRFRKKIRSKAINYN